MIKEALAKKANIPYTTFAKIESEVEKKPSIPTMMKIYAGLNITLDELMNQ